MASVESSRSGKYAHLGVVEEEPPDHLESAGELLIKQMVQKQTNTKLTLDELLKQKKKFARGVGFVPLNELPSGTSSLQEFEKRRQLTEKVEELEGKGLTRGEVALLLGERQSKATDTAQEAIQEYCNHLHTAQPPENNHGTVKRQELEMALSIKPESVETRLYQFAMKNTSVKTQIDSRPPDHPIYHLAEMEQSILKTANPEALARTLRRKRRQQVEALAEPQWVHYKTPDRLHSLWDAIEPPAVVSKKICQQKKIVTCKKQTLYTIREGKIVQLDEAKAAVDEITTEAKYKPSGQAFVSLHTQSGVPNISGKLSENEIKQLPKFQNYDPGNVSKILYIKNLSSSVTENDLTTLFDQFQEASEDKIIYRLMKGKLRGQAFIKFIHCEFATLALKTMNGTILKGRPMVIQYGRQQD